MEIDGLGRHACISGRNSFTIKPGGGGHAVGTPPAAVPSRARFTSGFVCVRVRPGMRAFHVTLPLLQGTE